MTLNRVITLSRQFYSIRESMRELRCRGNKLHALVIEDDPKPQGIVEISCDSRFCGKQAGVVILHRFDLSTGEYSTARYSEPNHRKEQHGHC